MFTTVRPRSVGSFFISRSSERAKLRAVASSRWTSSRERSAIDSRCRRSVGAGGSRSSRITRMSAMRFLLGAGDEQDLVDLVHLDELHLDALVPRGRQVLADVVGTDGKLSMAAIREAGELDARRPAVVEECIDRRADRAAGVEDIVDEDDGAALERELELRRAEDRLGVARWLAATDLDVVAVEGDVQRAEIELSSGEILDQAAEPMRQRDAARLDADERHSVERRVALDDLVGDAAEALGDRRQASETRSSGSLRDSIASIAASSDPSGTRIFCGAFSISAGWWSTAGSSCVSMPAAWRIDSSSSA